MNKHLYKCTTPLALGLLTSFAYIIASTSFFVFLSGHPADELGLFLSLSALLLTYVLLFASSLRLLTITLWKDRLSEPQRGGWMSNLMPLSAILLLLISQETSHQLSGLLWVHPAVDLLFSLIPLTLYIALTLAWMIPQPWRYLFAVPLIACAFLLPPTLTFATGAFVEISVQTSCASKLPPGSCTTDCYSMSVNVDEHILRRPSPIKRFF